MYRNDRCLSAFPAAFPNTESHRKKLPAAKVCDFAVLFVFVKNNIGAYSLLHTFLHSAHTSSRIPCNSRDGDYRGELLAAAFLYFLFQLRRKGFGNIDNRLPPFALLLRKTSKNPCTLLGVLHWVYG